MATVIANHQPSNLYDNPACTLRLRSGVLRWCILQSRYCFAEPMMCCCTSRLSATSTRRECAQPVGFYRREKQDNRRQHEAETDVFFFLLSTPYGERGKKKKERKRGNIQRSERPSCKPLFFRNEIRPRVNLFTDMPVACTSLN